MKNTTGILTEPADETVLAVARAALAEAAAPPLGPSLAATIRREAARRRLARRVRLAVSSASSAAAALAVAALVAFPPRHGGRGGAKAQGAGDTREALQMLMCDAAEAAETSVEVDWDCTDFDFADALLAWQEAPLAM